MTFPRSPEEQDERQARLDVFAALGSFPALLTCHGELWTLHGHRETEYERVRTLFATPDDLRDLTSELRTHRRVPGVWEALKNLPPSPAAPHGADDYEPEDEYRYGFIGEYAAVYPASAPSGGRPVSPPQLDSVSPPQLDSASLEGPPSPAAPRGADDHEPVDEYRYGFIAGYAAVYPASVPRGGRFVSLPQLNLAGLEVPCDTDARGYRDGLEAYVRAFTRARSGPVDPGRLTPPGPTLPEQQEVTP